MSFLPRGVGERCLLALMLSCVAAGRPWANDAAATDTVTTAWALVASALVVFMPLPGLALFHGGLRAPNLLSILMHCSPLPHHPTGFAR